MNAPGGGRASHSGGGTYSTFGDGHSDMQVHRQWALCIGIACGVSVPRGTRLPAAVCEAQPCGAGQVGASCVRSRVRTRLVGQEGTNGAAGGAQRARGGPENVRAWSAAPIQESPTQPKMKRWDPRNSGAGWPQAGPRHVKARSGQLVTLSANKRERTGAVSRFLLIGWIPERAPCGIVTAASARRLHEPHGQSR